MTMTHEELNTHLRELKDKTTGEAVAYLSLVADGSDDIEKKYGHQDWDRQIKFRMGHWAVWLTVYGDKFNTVVIG